jgi:hypothetical protein
LLPYSRYYEAYLFGKNWIKDFENPILPVKSHYFEDDFQPVLTYTMNYLRTKNIPEDALEKELMHYYLRYKNPKLFSSKT